MKLNEIRNNPGAHKHKHKVGRGSSSGLGKTSGRGVKGAKARTGTKVYGFEGGQMPLHMRIPKRGFNNIFANDFSEVNIGLLQKAIDDKRLKIDGKITEEVLRKAGLAHKSRDGVRLLGKGAITAKIDIEVAGASAGARRRSKRPAARSPPPSRRRSIRTRRASRANARSAAADATAKRAARQG